MAAATKTKLQSLARRIGHDFADVSLLRRALTHSSARNVRRHAESDNERLEFLGDRVLGLCVAEMLMAELPEAAEGELAVRLNRLVRKETCAAVAQEDWDLDGAVIMSGGEVVGSGRRKLTILGNACEAVLGAIYLDGGIKAAKAVVEQFWGPRLLTTGELPRDAKTALQEWAQGNQLALPKYVEADRSGPDHAPQFKICVEIENREPATGTGPSKRIAEQRAAQQMLIDLKVWPGSDDDD